MCKKTNQLINYIYDTKQTVLALKPSLLKVCHNRLKDMKPNGKWSQSALKITTGQKNVQSVDDISESRVGQTKWVHLKSGYAT